MIRAVLLALVAACAPAAAQAPEAPPISAVIDCGSLQGLGWVRIRIHGTPVGVVRVECSAA